MPKLPSPKANTKSPNLLKFCSHSTQAFIHHHELWLVLRSLHARTRPSTYIESSPSSGLEGLGDWQDKALNSERHCHTPPSNKNSSISLATGRKDNTYQPTWTWICLMLLSCLWAFKLPWYSLVSWGVELCLFGRGLTSSPQQVIKNPMNLPKPTPNTHFDALRHNLCLLKIPKTLGKSKRWSPKTLFLITMSSMYTYTVFPI